MQLGISNSKGKNAILWLEWLFYLLKNNKMADKTSNLWKMASDTAVSEDGMKFNVQGNSVL